jgi:N-dimethylarginine dimethylaminohydrolase
MRSTFVTHHKYEDRREFIKTAAAASAVALTAGISKVQGAEGKTGEKNNMVQVHHEWGTLKEVVCGIPNFRIPTRLPEAIYNYAPTEGIRFMEANLGKSLREADPETYKKVARQMDATVSIMESRGVKVHRLEAVTDDENAYLSGIFSPSVIQFFPRDPMLVIGNHVIETELFLPARRRERFGVRRAIAKRLADSNAQYVSMPPAVPVPEQKDGKWGPGPFIEGGDVFLIGKDIYVGVSGNASNSAGVQWLSQHLGSEYRVHEIKLTKKFLHLDCCLATPREGLAIICREAFADGLPDFLKDWQLIELPYIEAKEMLGCNGLVLDNKSIIIHTDLPHLGKALRDAGQEVIETPFDAVYQYAGAFRCWHHPLIRESKLEG